MSIRRAAQCVTMVVLVLLTTAVGILGGDQNSSTSQDRLDGRKTADLPARGKSDDNRILIDRTFLESHPRDLHIFGIARGETFLAIINLKGDVFRGHCATHARLKSPTGKFLIEMPVKDGRGIRFEFSRKEISLDSLFELTCRRDDEVVTFVLPFSTLVDQPNDIWIVD